MISYEDAIALMLAEAESLAPETVATNEALGRVLAEAVIAPVSLQPFDNSAMDGFALMAQSQSGETRLQVTGSVAAGDAPKPAIGQAVEIMTGAPVPAGFETVVPVENCVVERGGAGQPVAITIQGPIAAGNNIRLAGQDVQQGQSVISAGTKITAMELMLLHAMGVARVEVVRQPSVAVFSTGAELVDDPGAKLAPGQIHNSNQPYLMAELANWPVQATAPKGHPDTKADFLDLIERHLGDDIIITTGAVSMGARDFIPQAMADIGANTLFHKAKIRPGKPVFVARLPRGGWFFGLPGNPVSAAAGLRFFVLPVLRKLLGLPAEKPTQARLANDFRKKQGLTMFAKARASMSATGVEVAILPGQESFRIAPLIAANCWAQLPEDAAEVKAGDVVPIHWFGEI